MEKYWELNDSTSNGNSKYSFQDYVEKYRELLNDSVKIRALNSDVPVGAYLSSGIDSSSIVSLMSQYSKVKTFTIGFNSDIDELNESRKVAQRLGSDHNEITLSKSDWDLLPQIICHLDEPVGDPIILPTYLLSSFASKKVKVVLTGDGADELLGGYVHHQSFFRLKRLLKYISFNQISTFSKFLKLIPSDLINIFFPYPAKLSSSGKERAISFLSSIPNETSMYLNFASLFDSKEKKGLYTKQFTEEFCGESVNYLEDMKVFLNGKLNPETIFKRIISLDLKTWLPNQILHKSDRLLLANSLEGRQPFLDYRLAEFLYNLPDDYKVSFWQTKVILRKAMKNILPDEIINSKKKAFYLPLQGYFFNEYSQFIKQYLLPGNIKIVEKELMKKEELRSFVENNLENNDLLTTKKLFALATLELWLQNQG